MSRLAKLESFADQHPNGGYEWTGYDLQDALEIAKTDKSFAQRMAFMEPTTTLPPHSRYHLPGEDYVKRVILEELGVLSQVGGYQRSKHGQAAWIMKGVCPFHRRVHAHQNWVVCEGRKGQPTFARCMKPLKRFQHTNHYPTKNLGDLAIELPQEKYEDRVY